LEVGTGGFKFVAFIREAEENVRLNFMEGDAERFECCSFKEAFKDA
jgi:hypothetical protein